MDAFIWYAIVFFIDSIKLNVFIRWMNIDRIIENLLLPLLLPYFLWLSISEKPILNEPNTAYENGRQD